MRKEGFFFPAATRKDDMTDRHTDKRTEENSTAQNRTEKKRAQHSNNVTSLRACFSFPPSQGQGFVGSNFSCFKYMLMCTCVCLIFRIQGRGKFLTWLDRLVPWSSFLVFVFLGHRGRSLFSPEGRSS